MNKGGAGHLVATGAVSTDNEVTSISNDEETRVFADEILLELNERPPLQCQITFDWHGNKQLAELVTGLIQVHALLMRRRHPWLRFDALVSILFHHDYGQALREISERAGRPCKATSEAGGIGLAMVVPLDEGCAAVFDVSVAFGIASEEESLRSLYLDAAMHELCHVHDYGRKRRLLAHEFLNRKLNGLEQRFFTSADSAWSEYFANKYSHSINSSHTHHPKLLAEVVTEVSTAIPEAIRAYRSHRRLNELVEFTESKVRLLFQCFGYAAGRLDALGSSLETEAPETIVALLNTGLIGLWEKTLVELQRLDNFRDDWSSFDELLGIMGIVEMALNHFGFFYRDTLDGVYVDIPLD